MTFGVTAVILLIQKLFRLAPLLANNQMDIFSIAQLLAYTVLAVSGLTLPISFLVACVLTFNRISNDSEYIIMRASGISFYRLLLPVLAIGMVMYGLSTAALRYGGPWGFLQIKSLFFDLASNSAQSFLKPGEFQDAFKGLVLYVDGADTSGQNLEGIFIADTRTQPGHIITAQHGQLLTLNDSLQVVLRLQQGHLHRHAMDESRYHLLSFDHYDVKLDLNTYVTRWVKRSTKPREMLPRQLQQEINRRLQSGEKISHLILLQYQYLTLPFACILFAGLGPSLGIVNTRSGRSSGYIFGVVVIFVYYLLLTVSEAFGEELGMPLLLAAWLPNLIMSAITFWFIYRAERGAMPLTLFKGKSASEQA